MAQGSMENSMLTILKCVFIFHAACINTHVKSPSNLTSNISLLSREQYPQRAWPTHLSISYCKMLILHWQAHALWGKLGYRGRLCHNFNVQYCQKNQKSTTESFLHKWKICVLWESRIWIHFQTTQQFIHLFLPRSHFINHKFPSPYAELWRTSVPWGNQRKVLCPTDVCRVDPKIAWTNTCFYWLSEAKMQCTPLTCSVKCGKHPVCCECARERWVKDLSAAVFINKHTTKKI